MIKAGQKGPIWFSSSVHEKNAAQNESEPNLSRDLFGASVLCYAMPPGSSDVYFLLGKESEDEKRTYVSNRWSDFGGRVSSRMESGPEAAAREFVEETMAMVPFFPGDWIPRHGYGDIADSLSGNGWTYRIFMNLHADMTKKPLNHVCYVKRVAWDPYLPHRFLLQRTKLWPMYELDRIVDRLENSIGKTLVRDLEILLMKQDLSQVSLPTDTGLETPEIGDHDSNNNSFPKILEPVDCWWKDNSFHVTYYSTGSDSRFHHGSGHGKKVIRISDRESDPDRICIMTKVAPEFCKLVRAKATLTTMYEDLPTVTRHHPAIRLSKWKNQMTRVRINGCYLEKQRLQWWSLPQLEKLVVLHRNFRLFLSPDSCVLRHCFVPTAAVAVSKFVERQKRSAVNHNILVPIISNAPRSDESEGNNCR